MGDRYLFGDQRAYNKALVEVAGAIAIGATGAVGAKTGLGYSIVRNGVGDYTVTFKDRYVALLDASTDVSLINGTPGAANPYWSTPGPFTAGAAPTLRIFVWNPGGTALQDPANGATLYFSALFQNSSVP